MTTQPQPAPALAWHTQTESTPKVKPSATTRDVVLHRNEELELLRAQHQKTVRLLEDMIESARHWIREANRGGAEFNWEAETYEARAHIVSNPQQEGAAK